MAYLLFSLFLLLSLLPSSLPPSPPYVCAIAYIWKSENNIQEVVLFVHHEYQETSLDTQMSDGITSVFTHKLSGQPESLLPKSNPLIRCAHSLTRNTSTSNTGLYQLAEKSSYFLF